MGEHHRPAIQAIKPKRPISVTLLALAVLIIGIVHLIRLVQGIQQWNYLASLPGVSPLYLALTGLVWAGICLPLAWGLWRGTPWSPFAASLAIPAYLLYAWIDRLFIANRSVTASSDSSWPFCLGASLVYIIAGFWILARPKTKAFFRREP